MIRFLRLDHVVLRVSDLDRMLAFYVGVLGCREERRLDDIGLVQLRAGEALIDLVPLGKPLPDAGSEGSGLHRNMDHFCLSVEDWDSDALTQYLAGRGVEVGEVSRRYGAEGFGPSIYIDDPEGNTVELKGPPE